jgi:hypothetical protein
MEMREPNQRFWDAMIIKCWQNFDSCLKLNTWCHAEFGKYPQDLELKRAQNCFSKGGQSVRVWVAEYMPALSERLFALPKERHLEVLDWLASSKVDSLTSKGSKSRKYYHEARTAMKAAERKATQKTWSDNLEKNLNRNNRWTTVK